MGRDRDDSLGPRLSEQYASEVVFRVRLVPQREVLYVSPAVFGLIGLDPGAFYSNPDLLLDAIATADQKGEANLDFDKLAPATLVTRRMRHRDRREIWTEYVLWPIREGGLTTTIDGTIRDVSKWKKDTTGLSRIVRMLSDVFDGVVGVDTRTTKFTESDPKALSLLGLKATELTSKGLSDVFDEATCARLIKAGPLIASGELGRSSFEAVIRRRGGQDADVTVRMSSSNTDPSSLLLIFEDRTAKSRLGVERTRLEAAISNATDAVAIIDSSHSFLFTNPAFQQLTGYSARECVGYRPDIFRALIPEPAFWEGVRERELWKGVVRGEGKGGRRIDSLASVNPIPEPGTDSVTFVVVVHDLTETQAAIAALARERTSRDRLTEALALLDERASIEEKALALCQAALAMPNTTAALILDLSLETEPQVIAANPPSGFERLTRHLLAPARIQAVIARAADNSWLEPTAKLGGGAEGPGFNLENATTLALSRITCHERAVGLLAVVGPEGLSKELRPLANLASTASGLMGKDLVDRADIRRIRREITDLLAHRQFRPIFQPIIQLEDGGTAGWEAYSRFEDGASPVKRFAEAIRADMAIDLEAATTKAAVTETRLNDPRGWLSLNVSATFLGSGDKLLELLPGPDRMVVLELTDANALDERARATLANLPPNVQLAVDSTSKEVHTLRAIVDLRPAFIKLPMDLIRGINRDRVRQALVAGLAHFARSTSSELVAVGIETEEELITLMDLRVTYGQGYYLGPAGFFPISVWSQAEAVAG